VLAHTHASQIIDTNSWEAGGGLGRGRVSAVRVCMRLYFADTTIDCQAAYDAARYARGGGTWCVVC
jgi:hypothetical protein